MYTDLAGGGKGSVARVKLVFYPAKMGQPMEATRGQPCNIPLPCHQPRELQREAARRVAQAKGFVTRTATGMTCGRPFLAICVLGRQLLSPKGPSPVPMQGQVFRDHKTLCYRRSALARNLPYWDL